MLAERKRQLAELRKDPAVAGFLDFYESYEGADELDIAEAVAGTIATAAIYRNWVVSVTEYGGHEAHTGVYGPYTRDEAVDKLRELADDPEAGAEGAFGGHDWEDESTQISVSQLYK